MRPLVLDPVFRSVRALAGVGPKHAKAFEKLLGGERIIDLLWHAPIELIDRRHSPKLKDAKAGQVVTAIVTVQAHQPARRRGTPARVVVTDGSATLDLVYFNAHGDWLEKTYPVGAHVVISGRVEPYNNRLQMAHPDHAGKPEELESIARVEPVYPMTQGLGPKQIARAIEAALKTLPDLPEWNDAPLMAQRGWPAWTHAMHALHHPESAADLDPETPVRARLAYDELLARALAMQLVRARNRRQKGRIFAHDSALRTRFFKSLPFQLTGAQRFAIAEIDADMQAPLRMLRLVQGDVGSGKTVVAFAAMLNAVATGAQAAMMAPTELLARQHARTLAPLADALGISIAVLTGRDKAKTRQVLLEKIKSGAAQIVIGTHALFQEAVEFHDLGLAVIDEQHRFGVHQRLELSSKGFVPDILVMTATPIPRTLTLSLYGDMDISRLNEKPPGRKPVETRLISGERIDEVVAGLKRKIANGARAYWVCPLVAENEDLDLAAATERHTDLQAHFGARAGLLHGQMKPADKDRVMQQFAQGDIDILVATTVIEVGVDVPEASVMVIEHAERFGLAQLHQLRGRVGRGQDEAACILMFGAPLSEMAKERLRVIRETEDGFVIAEKDLALRGAGEVLGTRQSGLPAFHLADPEAHGDLMEIAYTEAKLLAEKDPALTTRRGEALKVLLYLFAQDAAIQTLRSG
ncbi:MAG: ATP-dependent DNA helicase RecG [Rhodospirillales bacterium]|nr:ATP-dependent DNA helicase RecG [Alphaproteobacteria bacterium]MCB9986206.1 ATP-dependent DNA helicase RecG [Rhodospirillales bacterium]USO07237.1 MAG: ATP-dependent DNA helicase RecG [Rhodospirillales bacterium]